MLPLIGTERPNAPIFWPFSHAVNFNMARHHILPYNTLRDLWNQLAQTFADTNWPESRLAIRHFLMLCNHKLLDLDPMLEALRRNNLTVVQCNVLEETAVWAAWNIVDGPKNRSDDPGDSGLDRFTFGVTQEEFGRMGIIEGVYSTMDQFQRVVRPQPVHLRVLAEALNLARFSLNSVEQPIPFRPGMWERDPDGRWRKRRSGEQFLTATSQSSTS